MQLLFEAHAILECMRIACLYGDFTYIPPLLLSDACENARDIVSDALKLISD